MGSQRAEGNNDELNIAIDSVEDERNTRHAATTADQDDKIEKSSQFDCLNFTGDLEYDEEDNDDEAEVNLNFSAMLYSSKQTSVQSNPHARSQVQKGPADES